MAASIASKVAAPSRSSFGRLPADTSAAATRQRTRAKLAAASAPAAGEPSEVV